jgi:4'-phosphopantetheinyl transferase EntD
VAAVPGGVASVPVAAGLGRVGVTGSAPPGTTSLRRPPNTASILGSVLPPWAAFAEAFGDEPAEALFAAERAVVAGAVAGRVAEFATGRVLARRALADLGVPPSPLLPADGGAPRWPHGIVGSITHCRGYRAAVAAPSALAAGIGIDAEPNAPLPDRVLDRISQLAERHFLAGATTMRPEASWDRLLFCCKEAVYKAAARLSPDLRRVADVTIRLDIRSGTFTALPVRACRADAAMLRRARGRWSVRAGLLLAVFVVPAGADATAIDRRRR